MGLSPEDKDAVHEEKQLGEQVGDSERAKQVGELTFYQEAEFLFRRFTFFLLSISFLVVAFVTLVIEIKDMTPETLVLLAHLLAGLASFVSFSFFVINYVTVRTLHLRRREPDSKQTGAASIGDAVKPQEWLGSSWKDILNFMLNPLAFSKGLWSSYTWFIPLVFYVVWLASWAITLGWVVPLIFWIALSLLSILYIYKTLDVDRVVRWEVIRWIVARRFVLLLSFVAAILIAVVIMLVALTS